MDDRPTDGPPKRDPGRDAGGTFDDGAMPVARYRSRRVRPSGRSVVLVAGLVAATVVAAIALASAVKPGGGAGTAAPAASLRSSTAASGALGGASAAVGTTPTPSATPAVRVVSGGDTMGDRQVKASIAAHGGDAVLAGIARYFRVADAAWVNLESPLTSISDPWPGKDVHFQGDPRLAPALARAGIDVVTMANNHAMDQGSSGLLDSIRRVERAGVQVVGAGRDGADAWTPAIVHTKQGATIGFLGWTDIIWPGYEAGSGPGVATARTDMGKVVRAIRRLKRKVDYVVVAFHWGVEYTAAPITAQVSEARAAIDAGADLVIGHHPHVLQGVQLYKHHLIVYSLGDLVFDHYDLATGQTVLVDAVLTPHGVRATLVPVYASSGGVPSVVTGAAGSAILVHMQQLSAALGTRLTIRDDRAFVRSAGR